MDKILDQQFERIEKALSTLIHSISTYNPSPTHAQDLLSADQALSQGLSLLSTHQANHQKIQSLKTLSGTLDAQIASTLSLLASTRQKLVATPATVFEKITEQQKNISYTELLDYARRISRFTLPGDYREVIPGKGGEGSVTHTGTSGERDGGSAKPNGGITPVAGVGVGVGVGVATGLGDAMDIDAPEIQNGGRSNGFETIASAVSSDPTAKEQKRTQLPHEISSYLDPLKEYAFQPWPTEDVPRKGALASIQSLMDRGIEIEGYVGDVGKVVEEDERGRVEEEENNRISEEQDKLRGMERRRSSGGVAPGIGQVPLQRMEVKQFSLDDLDDDD